MEFRSKIYRFKEHGWWMYDKDAYYSNTSRRYFAYANTLVWPSLEASVAEELIALKVVLAIGELLNRVVILPRFHCTAATAGGGTTAPAGSAQSRGGAGGAGGGSLPPHPDRDCPMDSLLNVTAFDAVFADRYRESSFLRHPLVPDAVTLDRSPPTLLVTRQNIGLKMALLAAAAAAAAPGEDVRLLTAGSTAADAAVVGGSRSPPPLRLRAADILEMFEGSPQHVLVFSSLYRNVPDIGDGNTDSTDFEGRIKKAFHRGNYRQL